MRFGVLNFIAGALLSFFIIVLWPSAEIFFNLNFSFFAGVKVFIAILFFCVVIYFIVFKDGVLLPLFFFVAGASKFCLIWLCLFPPVISRVVIIDGVDRHEKVGGIEAFMLYFYYEPWVYCSILIFLIYLLKVLGKLLPRGGHRGTSPVMAIESASRLLRSIPSFAAVVFLSIAEVILCVGQRYSSRKCFPMCR